MPGRELVRLGDTLRAKAVAQAEATVQRRRAEQQAVAQRAVDAAAEQAAKLKAVRAARRRSAYAAAVLNRLNASDFLIGAQSADLALRGDLRTLKDRARQVRRDAPLAARYAQLCVENIVGFGAATGIDVRPDVLDDEGEPDEATNAYLRERWLDWAENYASVDRRRSLRDILELAVDQWKTEGEALLALLPFRNPYGFALQLLDTDQLDEQYFAGPFPNGNEVRMSVEIDSFGAPVAFYLWTRHPSEPGGRRERKRVPVESIIHLYRPDRPVQTRGVSKLVTVLNALQMLDGTNEAILVQLRAAACQMGFLTRTADTEAEVPTSEEEESGEDPYANVPTEAAPGVIGFLPAGVDFKPWAPGQPTQEYEAFSKIIQRWFAMGLGVSYASLTGDLSDANYGSQRGGLLSERDGWRRDQQFLISRGLRPIYHAWIRWGLMSGALALPFEPERLSRAHYQPRGFDWIDPAKDIDAKLREVDAGLDTLTNIAAERGRDFARNLQVRQREIALAKQLGVPLVISSTAKALPAAAESPTDGGDGSAESTPPAGRGRALAAVR